MESLPYGNIFSGVKHVIQMTSDCNNNFTVLNCTLGTWNCTDAVGGNDTEGELSSGKYDVR